MKGTKPVDAALRSYFWAMITDLNHEQRASRRNNTRKIRFPFYLSFGWWFLPQSRNCYCHSGKSKPCLEHTYRNVINKEYKHPNIQKAIQTKKSLFVDRSPHHETLRNKSSDFIKNETQVRQSSSWSSIKTVIMSSSSSFYMSYYSWLVGWLERIYAECDVTRIDRYDRIEFSSPPHL